MTAFDAAFARAASGLDWSYPCLIWVADYLRDETGVDPAAEWRGVAFDEASAMRELARLAVPGKGATAVDRALDGLASRFGWVERDAARQGAVMVGVYAAPNGEGYPAIFDGWRGWLVAFTGNATILRKPPARMWELVT